MSGRTRILTVICAAAVLSSCVQPTPIPIDSTHAAVIDAVCQSVTVSSFQSRMALFSNCRYVATTPQEVTRVEVAIIADLTSWGYGIETEDVSVPSMWVPDTRGGGEWRQGPFSMQNIIATKPGEYASQAPVIVAAHHDTVPFGPGSNDDGSGCAGVLEIANALRLVSLTRTVLFAFFAFEEEGLVGSTQYAESLQAKELPDSVLVFDTIGFTSDKELPVPLAGDLLGLPSTGDFIGAFGSRDSRSLILDFLQSSSRTVPELKVFGASADSGLPDDPFLQDILRSDQSPFWQRGVPALMITDTANLRGGNVYHSAQDDLAHIDYEFATRVVRATLSTVCARAGIR
jgi:hypothetical protein